MEETMNIFECEVGYVRHSQVEMRDEGRVWIHEAERVCSRVRLASIQVYGLRMRFETLFKEGTRLMDGESQGERCFKAAPCPSRLSRHRSSNSQPVVLLSFDTFNIRKKVWSQKYNRKRRL